VNPVISLAEDALAIAGLVVAFIAPVAVAVATIVVTVTCIALARVAFRRRAATRA
jgi:hypothetical protein